MPATVAPVGMVVDCSVALAWHLDDEKTTFTERVLDLLPSTEAWVPALWRLEFANALLVAQRRGRISEEWRATVIEQASRLPIGVDTHLVSLAQISELAARYQLTTYDAAYLELALRRKLTLVTLDADLVRAMRAADGTLLTDTGRYPVVPKRRKK